MAKVNPNDFKFDALQIETIINKVVPLVAAPDDHEHFKGILHIYASECNSVQFSAFIAKLLKQAHKQND